MTRAAVYIHKYWQQKHTDLHAGDVGASAYACCYLRLRIETAVPNPAVMAFQRKLLSPDSRNKMEGQNRHNIE
jgi:hypothetical protein